MGRESQGLEPNAKSFCHSHELLYETKPWGKEQYHNNFSCYSFIARSGSSSPVSTFRKRWPRDWTKEWFYVKNDLKVREYIRDIIMRPIWQRFGLRKPKVEMDEAAEECQRAFGVVCSFIGTRDLIQEHIAFRVWPLVEKWEMPEETISKPDEGGLVRLKYTFRYGYKFTEPDDDWLKCIEATSDELLGPYSKAENTALSAVFVGWKKKRLNRVFDAIGFVYPDYRYPIRGQKRKDTAFVKEVASAAPSEPSPKRKKMKVLTHRPRYIEPAIVPEFVGETSSATEAKEPTPLPNIEEPAMIPEMEKIEEPRAEEAKTSEILSPSSEAEVPIPMPRVQKDLTTTPKRKRMVNVLDVLETIKSSSFTSKIAAEAPKTQIEAEAGKSQAKTETGLSEPTKREFLETEKEKEKESAEKILSQEIVTSIPEASFGASDYVLRHASGKNLSEKEKGEAHFYAKRLKYPKGALIFNGSGEEDFLYCLPDSKEISVCREMSKSFGFPTLEDGLSVLSKDDLADSLAYNSLKVKR
jgi:hypothetical protein